MLAGMKFARWVVCCVLLCAPVAAQSGSSPLKAVKKLKGKIVFLRDMDLGDKLSFDAQGNQIGMRTPGAFAYSAIKIEKVRISKSQAQIKGHRLALLAVVPKNRRSYRKIKFVVLDEPMRITIASDPTDPQALEVALTKVFARTVKDELSGLAPKEEAEALNALSSTAPPEPGSADFRLMHLPRPAHPKLRIAVPGFEDVNSKDITPPRLIHAVEPGYPDEARRKKIDGTCILSLIVDSNGRPIHIRIVRPVDPGLAIEAIIAVSKYRFAPATYQGRPVLVFIDVKVDFRIY